jgi:S-adenosylmethionine:tRNA ribosyltransferase-isomerase
MTLRSSHDGSVPGHPLAHGKSHSATFDFTLPEALEAHEPPEARGITRDAVNLLVSCKADDAMWHVRFAEIGAFFQAGDVLVINTSGTLPAAVAAQRADGTQLRLHLSTRLPGDIWTVELRQVSGSKTVPFAGGRAGETLRLPDAAVTLLVRYREGSRLWRAKLTLPAPLEAYLAAHGKPIHYGYLNDDWDIRYYQTVYATEAGSAEMPSAGRAFTPEIITQLVAKGVTIAPLLLHTGVASLEDHEPPYVEYYRVPPQTASVVTQANAEGRRVIAVGTTVVRALETVTDANGATHPGEGYTELLITPERGVRAVSGILTGWHEPRATHLLMLAAIASRRHLAKAYRAALERGYLWHEFGDMHLILP